MAVRNQIINFISLFLSNDFCDDIYTVHLMNQVDGFCSTVQIFFTAEIFYRMTPVSVQTAEPQNGIINPGIYQKLF